MDKKYNFMGIIIPVVIAVILMSVIPIFNDMTSECPPCAEIPSYNIGNLEVNPDFSSGNYIVDKGSYDYLDSVTIIKDVNLIPENIKKDVNIYGVVGTLESGEGVYLTLIFQPSGSWGQHWDGFFNINGEELRFDGTIGDNRILELSEMSVTATNLIFGDYVSTVTPSNYTGYVEINGTRTNLTSTVRTVTVAKSSLLPSGNVIKIQTGYSGPA